MTTYEDMRKAVVKFIHDSKIGSYDLVRIAKDLCSCKECKYYIQHYDATGKEVDFGHCIKNNTVHSRRPYQQSCGGWEWRDG